MTTVITDTNGMIRFHFLSLRGAVKLEKAGLNRSRKPSAKSIAIKQLQLPRSSNYDSIIEAITKMLGE